MSKLEVFFDYACPYCLRGHEYLMELLPRYPQIEVEWHPCEAHPRPDRYGPHSDLLARGMYFAQECGVDLLHYHRRMYRAALTDRANIENLRIVSGLMVDMLDSDAFLEALADGAYKNKLAENNRLAWSNHRFSAVPSYRMGIKLLKSIEDIGVTRERLAGFLSDEDWM